MTAPEGYTRPQIALHWIAALLMLQQCMFNDAISITWSAVTNGMDSAFNPLVLADVAGGALVLVLALWRLPIKAGHGAPEMMGDSALHRAPVALHVVGVLYHHLVLRDGLFSRMRRAEG
ncbi:MAG: hypothetical protein F9K34_09420 [Albidovulum sp.]|uniref:hypothetical protein n=1 Tax=Albidovulum sp. TaxID=1872424 RepID=UPI00132368FB|nr:hypothetical protein [Defluviimonas sp.]KAB2884241.1 MAG: hypothetical protein F9K34_09420 [Defluviimonas sp.]